MSEQTVKALTLIQPWATLIAEGWKGYETRSWQTSYRGMVLIHAGAKVDRGYLARTEIQRLVGNVKIPTSSFIAVATLVGCLHTEDVAPGLMERRFGDFSPGRFAWELEDVRCFRHPIPAKGMLGLWTPQSPVDMDGLGAPIAYRGSND